MYRRQQQEKRRFIYKKAIEDRENAKKRKRDEIRAAVDEMKPIPKKLKADAIEIHEKLDYEDGGGEDISPDLDNEYRWAGVEDPKIIITTSRDESSRLKQFAKEIKLIFPNSVRINRGNYEIKQLVSSAISNNASDLIILTETRGRPDGMIISHMPHGPTAYFTLFDTVMRHDIPNVGTMSEEYPLVMAHGINSDLGKRVIQVLSALFPPLKDGPRPKRVIGFMSKDQRTISFRHMNVKKVEGKVVSKEVGPRFEMKLYKILRDTIDNASTADVEYQQSSFVRSAKFHRPLGQPEELS